MTQFVIGVAALNHDSKFAAQYTAGMKKADYWVPALEDSLDCVAKSFTIAARIVRPRSRASRCSCASERRRERRGS